MASESAVEPIDALIASSLEALGTSVEPVGAAASAELLGPISLLAARGKRMRASLLLTAHEAAGGTLTESAHGVAAALELFQAAALIHDDVLDDSDTRRGIPATHRALEATHRAAGWKGDAARFGTNGAILAGDLALMACMRELVLALAGVEGTVAAEVGSRFTSMASLCTAGQYLDLRLASLPLASVADERDAIVATMRSKTASYTTEGPLALGAALAGLSSADVDAWARVGVPLGIAFQLRDDVLGVVGAEAVTGKPAGDDLREGKRTLIAAYAWEASGASDRALIAAAEGSDDPAVIAAAVDAVTRSGALDAVERDIADYAAQALDALDGLGIADVYRARLADLVAAAVSRHT